MPVRQRRARSTTDPACIVVILRRESGPGTWNGVAAPAAYGRQRTLLGRTPRRAWRIVPASW